MRAPNTTWGAWRSSALENPSSRRHLPTGSSPTRSSSGTEWSESTIWRCARTTQPTGTCVTADSNRLAAEGEEGRSKGSPRNRSNPCPVRPQSRFRAQGAGHPLSRTCETWVAISPSRGRMNPPSMPPDRPGKQTENRHEDQRQRPFVKHPLQREGEFFCGAQV